MKPAYQLILWTDHPMDAKAIRDEQSVKTVIRDATVFDGTVEAAIAIAFWGASNRQVIIDAYAAIGVTQVHDIPYDLDDPDYLPEAPVVVEAPVVPPEPTALDAQIEAMTDDEIREYIEKATGEKPHHAKKRDTLVAELKAAFA